MPRPQYIGEDAPDPLAATLSGFTKRGQELRESDAIRNIYQNYQNKNQTIDQLLMGINSDPDISPSQKVNIANQMVNLQKNQIDLQKAYISAAAQEQKEINKPSPQSEFEKVYQRKEAEHLIKLEGDIPKATDALSNLDEIIKLAEGSLSGLKGFGKAFLNTEDAAKMKSLGFTAIEPIIKLFNPVGPIPQQKIKMIREQFQPQPNELTTTIRGKVAALRTIGEQAVKRAKERVALIRKYKGQPPEEALEEFDYQTQQIQDALLDQQAFKLKLQESGDGNISGLYSKKNGKKLKPIPASEALKLYEAGEITNVPPS